MQNTIDEVSIEIGAESQSASSNLDNLSSSIEKLTNIVNTGLSGLNSFSSNLTKIKEITSGLSIDTTGMDKLKETLSGLTNISKATNLSSVLTELKQIPEISKNLDSKEIATFTSKIKELTDALSPLATEMVKVSTAFSALPNNISKINSVLDNTTKKVKQSSSAISSGLSGGLVGLLAKAGITTVGLKKLGNTIAGFVNESIDYIENVNFFSASLGEMAGEAQKFADIVSSKMGLDPSDIMRYTGTFYSLTKGFGLASNSAYTMSKNLTQLSYDMASFLHIPIDQAMKKLKSGISGEIEPLRAIGISLDQASLQETAYTLGINKKVSAMTRAQKTELAYYQIMKQTTSMQGNLARNLVTPANALMILKQQFTQLSRAIGNIFLPILAKIIPYIQVIIKWLTALANTIAKLFKFNLDDYKTDTSKISSSLGDVSSGVGDIGSSAKKTNKELDKMLNKFDELNVITFDKDKTSGAGDEGIGVGGSLGIPELDYDMTEGLKEGLDGVEKKLQKVLAVVGTIGAAFASWKIAKGLMNFFDYIGKLKVSNLSIGFQFIGLPLFLKDLKDLSKYIQDLFENGPTFKNVSGIISEFAGAIGDALLMLGNLKAGGALKAIQGIGEVVNGISDIISNGLNWENAETTIKGLTNIAIAIGVFTGHLELAGWATAIQGFTGIITEIGKNWEAIKNGDWSGVDKATMIISGIEVLGGIAFALSKIKKAKDASKSIKTVQEISSTVGSLDTNVGKMSPKLKSLAKNLGIGLVIIAEVAAAAILIAGAIWVLGKELEQVGIAWQPVIDNGKTVATAMGIGVGILVSIGVVTALLGSIGGPQIMIPIALGTAILVELGIAAGIFIAEIWAIGEGLNKISEAWQPVLTNGDSIISAITLGTTVLIAIGAAAGLLGVATTATAGLLPLAIGLGTAMLVELGLAAVIFIAEIWAIGEGLNKISEAWQPVLVNGETIKSAIEYGTGILIAIGVVSAALGVATVASVGLLPLAIKLGTDMLTQLKDAFISFVNNLIEVANQLNNNLHPELRQLNGNLPALNNDLSNYINFMETFAGYSVRFSKSSAVAGIAGAIDTIISWFTKDPIKKMADDVHKTYSQSIQLNNRLREANPELAEAINLMQRYFDFLDQLERLTGRGNAIQLANGMFANMQEVGKSLVTGFVKGINSENSSLNNAIKSVLNNSFSTRTAQDYGRNFGRELGSSIASALRSTSLPKFKGTINTSGSEATLRFSAYANGGFPEVGEMFIARERGPELVGNIGNRAAVANNDQIIEGIAQASYEGVSQALAENNGNSKQPINVYVGNKKVYSGFTQQVSSDNNMYGTNTIKV